MKKYSINIFLFTCVLFNLKSTQAQTKITSADYIHALKKVTDIMVNDVTSPVAASRYYAYVNLSAYESTASFEYSKHASFSGKVKGFKGVNLSDVNSTGASSELASIIAVFKAGQLLLPSGYLLKKELDSLAHAYASSAEKKLLYDKTYGWVDPIVRQIVIHAKTDGFVQLNNLSRYTPLKGDGYWQPTAPAFMAPVEPHWNTIRTFTLDSAQQFKTIRPAAYSTSKTSPFYKMMMEVYTTTKHLSQQQQDIANFWDCNPFAVQQIGHVEFGLKKISPGGHWIGITGICCLKKGFSLDQTILTHALVSMTMADAFIACWDEKYRSNRIRPETVIQRLVDPRWKPLLQTPPFPEYVSGHSVASNASAVMLTQIFGDHMEYDDDTEVEFGLPVRHFTSFKQAASEAAISRLYGGIHYMDAIEAGKWQGIQVGELAVKKLSEFVLIVRK